MSEPLPWDYLAHCSDTSLEAFMLEKMEEAARLRKELKVETERLIEVLVAIEVARILLRHGRELAHAEDLRQQSFQFDAPQQSHKKLLNAEQQPKKERSA